MTADVLHCKFPGDCDSERVAKIGQHLIKSCAEYRGLLVIMAHAVYNVVWRLWCDGIGL